MPGRNGTICSPKSHPVTFGRSGRIGEQGGRMRDAESFQSMSLKRPTNAKQLPIKRKMTTHGAATCVCGRLRSDVRERARAGGDPDQHFLPPSSSSSYFPPLLLLIPLIYVNFLWLAHPAHYAHTVVQHFLVSKRERESIDFMATPFLVSVC